MLTKSSECLIEDYDSVSEYCKTEGKPVIITEDDKPALVVMSMEKYLSVE